MSTQPTTNPSAAAQHAAIRAYHARIESMLKKLEHDITALEFQFRAGPAYLTSYPSPSLSTQLPSTPYLPSLPRFPATDSQMLPPPMYTSSLPMMPSMYIPSGSEMSRRLAQEREQARRGSGSGSGSYDFQQGEREDRGSSILHEQGETDVDINVNVDVNAEEVYDPINPLMDHGVNASKPYDLERYRRVSAEAGPEIEISWVGEGEGEVVTEFQSKGQGMEIDEDVRKTTQMEEGYHNSVERTEEEGEGETETEQKSQEMEIDYETGDQDQGSHVLIEVTEEDHRPTETVQDQVDVEHEVEEESDLRGQEMEIDYQTEYQDKDPHISIEAIERGEEREDEKDEPTAITDDISPINRTSEQFWAQLIHRENKTSDIERHLDSVEKHFHGVEKHFEIGEQHLKHHLDAQEELLERLSNQAYSPFKRSPAPGMPSPSIDGFEAPIPPPATNQNSSNPIEEDFNEEFKPMDGLGLKGPIFGPGSEHAKQMAKMTQLFGADGEHLKRMKEVLGPIGDVAAHMQKMKGVLGDGSEVVAHVKETFEKAESDGVWAEMAKLRAEALGKLNKKREGEGMEWGEREEWEEDLRMVEGGGMVYMLKRTWVDGGGERSEDVVQIDVPISTAGEETQQRESKSKDPTQTDEAETKVPELPEDAQNLTEKDLSGLFDETEENEDENGFWNGSSDAMEQVLDAEMQEIEDEYAAMQDDLGAMSDDGGDYEEEDEFLDSEWFSSIDWYALLPFVLETLVLRVVLDAKRFAAS